MKRLLFVAFLALLGLLGWFTRSHQPPAAMPPDSLAGGAANLNSHPPSASLPLTGAATNEGSTLADALNSPGANIAADLQIVSNVLENFRTNFLHTGNPVGDNAEITAALTGRNPLKLVLISAEHRAINARGELCDRWGTPFFFHQLSGTQMEIRSAGPDRTFHTPDDAVLTP